MTRIAPWVSPEWAAIVTSDSDPEFLADQLASHIRKGLQTARGISGGGGPSSFPALALPLGAEDNFVCPDEHLQHLRERLDCWDDAGLLVIGYSAIDSSVLRELRRGRPLAACLVVDRDLECAAAVGRRLASKVSVTPGMMLAFDGDFASFVADEKILKGFLARTEIDGARDCLDRSSE